MHRSKTSRVGRALAASVLACAIALPALATDGSSAASPASGLGQSWPAAQDHSASPRFHVYVFNRAGVQYIQVNDMTGNVRAAVAAANGHFLVLPLGSDAVSTPDDASPANASSTASTTTATTSNAETVYNDGTTAVTATTDNTGTTTFNTLSLKAISTGCESIANCSQHAQ